MLDWPEQSQTSPTRILVKTLVSAASMVSVCGEEEAFNLPSFTSQRPLLSECVAFEWLANLIVTAVPGAAQHQTGTSCCCCKTILSPKMAGSFSVAETRATSMSTAKTL